MKSKCSAHFSFHGITAEKIHVIGDFGIFFITRAGAAGFQAGKL